MDRPGIRFALGLDGISVWLFGLTSLLMITAIFASWETITDRAPLHYAFLLALQTGLSGLFASLDDADFVRQVPGWSDALQGGGLQEARLAHLHHLTPVNEAVGG